jgi:hypothetical protein
MWGVEAALFGHVAEVQPCPAVDRRAAPAHLAAIGSDQPEDAAHGCRLAGTVGAEQSQHACRPHGQAAAVERDEVAVALRELDEIEPRITHDGAPRGLPVNTKERYGIVELPETVLRRSSKRGQLRTCLRRDGRA